MGTLVGCIFHILDAYIIHFLTQKRLDPCFFIQEVNEVDIYKFDPFELPGLSEFQSDDQVWYFFSEPDYRNASSKKPHRVRATGAGYWKSTGHGCDVKDKNCKKVGSKRTLVFYKRESGRKETKTNWVMHEFYVKDKPSYKKNFVFCYIEKQPNKKPSVSTPADDQPSPSLASDSVNHVVQDTFTEVQSQQQPSHPLISDSGNQLTENNFTEVEAQQISSQYMVSDSRDLVAENIFSMVKSLVLRGQNLASDPANHIPENIFSTLGQIMVELDQPLSSQNMCFDYGNDIAENTSSMVEPQAVSPYNMVSQLGNHGVENNFPRVEPHLPLGYNMAFDSRNHVNTIPMVAPQLPSLHDMVFDPRNHVAENTFCTGMKSMPYGSFEHQPLVDLQLPSSKYLVSGSTNHVAENTCSEVYSSPPADFGALDGYNGLNYGSFSAPQIPVNPEQGSYSSSYSSNLSNDCNVWSSPFDGEHEDVANSEQDFQDHEYPHEGPGKALPAGMDEESIDMVNELYEDIPPIAFVNHN